MSSSSSELFINNVQDRTLFLELFNARMLDITHYSSNEDVAQRIKNADKIISVSTDKGIVGFMTFNDAA